MKTYTTWLGAVAVGFLLASGTAGAQGKPKEEAPKPAGVKVAAGSDGFAFQSESGDFKVQIRGLVQADARFYASDKGKLGTDTFLLRRARPIVTGSAGKYFEFNLTPDFGGGQAVIQDAYADIKFNAAARLRAGKFKPPIGLEHLQSDPILPFVERALAASLVPNRDVGLQLSGDLGGGVVSYAVGVFNGTADGGSVDLDVNDGKDAVGRLLFTPFKKGQSPASGLSFGIAGSSGKQSGAPSAYRTGGQLSFFSYATGVVAEGDRSRLAPELSFFHGPVAIIAEYARSKAGIKKTATSERHSIEARGWQATAGFFLTGDTASFSSVKVKKPFDPSKGQWGGFELVARVNALEIDDDAFSLGLSDITKSARKATAWGVGFNWYVNNNIRQAISYERTSFDGGAATGDRPDENALFIRTQLSF